jgi:hypothetical protein
VDPWSPLYPSIPENHGVDERSMRGMCPGSQAGTKLVSCHPQSCDTLTPDNSRGIFPILPGGFVSPMRAALSARVSPHDQHTLAMQMDALREGAT